MKINESVGGYGKVMGERKKSKNGIIVRAKLLHDLVIQSCLREFNVYRQIRKWVAQLYRHHRELVQV